MFDMKGKKLAKVASFFIPLLIQANLPHSSTKAPVSEVKTVVMFIIQHNA